MSGWLHEVLVNFRYAGGKEYLSNRLVFSVVLE